MGMAIVFWKIYRLNINALAGKQLKTSDFIRAESHIQINGYIHSIYGTAIEYPCHTWIMLVSLSCPAIRRLRGKYLPLYGLPTHYRVHSLCIEKIIYADGLQGQWLSPLPFI
jgi:hypothetical protein